MNKKEQNRLMVLNGAERRDMMTAKETARILGLSLRQVKGILAVYGKEDAVALVHGHYGRNIIMH